MVEEGEQFLPVTPQSLLQSPGMFLFPSLVDQLFQAIPDSAFSPLIDILPQTMLVFFQQHAVPDQAAKPQVKFRPVSAGIVVVPGPDQVTHQVAQAHLLGKADDRVAGTPEVGHQNPVEVGPEQLLRTLQPHHG